MLRENEHVRKRLSLPPCWEVLSSVGSPQILYEIHNLLGPDWPRVPMLAFTLM